jgi:hypothetical protein
VGGQSHAEDGPLAIEETGEGTSGSAPVIASNQRGESPCRGVLASRNCVGARRGGEQPEVNDQSVTRLNSIRPDVVVSLLPTGEAQLTLGSAWGGHRSVIRYAWH